MKHLLKLLAYDGGKIISSADLTPEEIQQARVDDRMWVDAKGFGYIYIPPNINKNVLYWCDSVEKQFSPKEDVYGIEMKLIPETFLACAIRYLRAVCRG